jgi:hypothetical protein
MLNAGREPALGQVVVAGQGVVVDDERGEAQAVRSKVTERSLEDPDRADARLLHPALRLRWKSL